MNPVRMIPMLPKPRRVQFIPRASLHSIPAIRTLAWRRGAGAADDGDTGPDYDPNVEAGFGYNKQTDPTSATVGTGTGPGALPSPNTSVYNSSQVSVTPATGANLRDQPSVNGNIIAGETQGTILQVVGQQQNGWLNVQDPQGRTGWIYSAYVADATSGEGTVPGPSGAPGAATLSSTPLGAGGIVGLLVVGGLVTGAYYLLVK